MVGAAGAFAIAVDRTTPNGLARRSSGEKRREDESWTDARKRTRMDVMAFMVVVFDESVNGLE